MMVANQGSSSGRSSEGASQRNRQFYRAELKLDDDDFVGVTEPNVGTHHFRRHVGQGRSGSASFPKRTGVMEVTRAHVNRMCKVDADASRRKQRSQQAFSKKKDAPTQHQDTKQGRGDSASRPTTVPEPILIKERARITVKEGTHTIEIKLHEISAEEFGKTLVGISEDLDSSCVITRAKLISRKSTGHIDITRDSFKTCTHVECDAVIRSSHYYCGVCGQKQSPHFDPKNWSTEGIDASSEPDVSDTFFRLNGNVIRRPSNRNCGVRDKPREEPVDFSPVFNIPSSYNSRVRSGFRQGRSEYLPPPPSAESRKYLEQACKDIGADSASVLQNYFTVLPEGLEEHDISAHFLRLCQAEIRKRSHDKGRRIKPRKFRAAVHMVKTLLTSTKTKEETRTDHSATEQQSDQQQPSPPTSNVVSPSIQENPVALETVNSSDNEFATSTPPGHHPDVSAIQHENSVTSESFVQDYLTRFGFGSAAEVSVEADTLRERFLSNSHLTSEEEQRVAVEFQARRLHQSMRNQFDLGHSFDESFNYCGQHGLNDEDLAEEFRPLLKTLWSEFQIDEQPGEQEEQEEQHAVVRKRVTQVAKKTASGHDDPDPGDDDDGHDDPDPGDDDDGNDNEKEDESDPPNRQDGDGLPSGSGPPEDQKPSRVDMGLGSKRGHPVDLNEFIEAIESESQFTDEDRQLITYFAPNMVHAAWDGHPPYILGFYPPDQWRTPLIEVLRSRRLRHERNDPPAQTFSPISTLDGYGASSRAHYDVYRTLFNVMSCHVFHSKQELRRQNRDVNDFVDIFEYLLTISVLHEKVKKGSQAETKQSTNDPGSNSGQQQPPPRTEQQPEHREQQSDSDQQNRTASSPNMSQHPRNVHFGAFSNRRSNHNQSSQLPLPPHSSQPPRHPQHNDNSFSSRSQQNLLHSLTQGNASSAGGGDGGDDDSSGYSTSSDEEDSYDERADTDTDNDEDDRSAARRRGGKRKSKVKKRRARSTAKVFAELSKSAYNNKLPIIGAHADSRHSQTYFAQWKRKLQDVLQLTRETEKFFYVRRSTGLSAGTKTDQSSAAVFQLIKSHCNSDLVHLLEQLPHRTGSAAFQLVQRRLCPTDTTAQRQALTMFMSLSIDQGETIKNFDKRFNRALAKCETNGLPVDGSQTTSTYLQATLSVTNQHVALQLIEYRRDFNYFDNDPDRNKQLPEHLSLIEIQSTLERVEESTTPFRAVNSTRPRETTNDRSTRRTDTRRDTRSTSRSTRRTASANLAETTVKCHGCQSESHRLRDCPNKTDAEKAAIWDRINRSRPPRSGRGGGGRGAQQRSTRGRPDSRRSASNQSTASRQPEQSESTRSSTSSQRVTHINMCIVNHLPPIETTNDEEFYSDDDSVPPLFIRDRFDSSSDSSDSDNSSMPSLIGRTYEDSSDDEDLDDYPDLTIFTDATYREDTWPDPDFAMPSQPPSPVNDLETLLDQSANIVPPVTFDLREAFISLPLYPDDDTWISRDEYHLNLLVEFAALVCKEMNWVRQAHVNMARKRERRLPLSQRSSTIDNETHEHDIFTYNDSVILDSGATDSICNNLRYLGDIFPINVEILLSDNSITHSTMAGRLRMQIMCAKKKKLFQFNLPNTLYVPNFTHMLWSVVSFAKQGHEVIFGDTTVRIVFNVHSEKPITVHLNHPYYQRRHNWPEANGAFVRSVEVNSFQARHVARSPSSSHNNEAIAARSIPPTQAPNPKKVDAELLHRRLGHQSIPSLVAAGQEGMYTDLRPYFAQKDDCIDCLVGGIRAKNSGSTPVAPSSDPGHVFFLDIIPVPSRKGVTFKAHAKDILLGVDSASSHAIASLLADGKSSSNVIEALEKMIMQDRPNATFTLDEITAIHVDAGTQLISQEFQDWCAEKNIDLQIAAPHHQEQNARVESVWRHLRIITYKQLTHARLSHASFIDSFFYAVRVRSVLPLQSCLRVLPDGTRKLSCSSELYHKMPARISRFRVFGCPAVMKVHSRPRLGGEAITTTFKPKNIIQRGVRGMFIGLPINQAGYEILIPSTGERYVCEDVAFDENFSSPLAYNEYMFRDALPTRDITLRRDPTKTRATTGQPFVDPDPSDPDDPWPIQHIYTDGDDLLPLFDPNEDRDDISPLLTEEEGTIPAVPNAQNEDDLVSQSDSSSEEESLDSVDDPEDPPQREHPVEDSGRYPKRQAQPTDFYAPEDKERHLRQSWSNYAQASKVVSSFMSPNDPAFTAMAGAYAAAVEPAVGQPGSDPSPFLPEPRGLYEVIKLPPRYKTPWLKAFVSELLGLQKLKVWKLSDPRPTDKIIPVMDVYKAKIDINGNIDKLKVRMVFRGDLDKEDRGVDPWYPHASFLSLKFFLALAADINRPTWQYDLIQAYVNAPIKHARVFIRLPAYWRPHVPEELRKYIGVPLELQKALYGLSFSGLLLYEHLAEFLRSFDMQRSVMNGLWFKRLPNRGLLIFLAYSDDCLSCCSSDETHDEFRTAFARKFPLNAQPNANWYLAARINRDKHGNMSLDQFRYSRSICMRYIPNSDLEPSEEEKRKYVDPLPRTFEWTTKDCSESEAQVKSLEVKYGFRFPEVLGSLNYLSNTALKLLFAIRKASKFTRTPGARHFKALNHLLHHLRCHPPKAITFYHDPNKSPLKRMLVASGHPDVDPLMVYYSDSAFMDCDDRKSTGSHLGLYRGGCVEMVTGTAGVTPDSTAEAEAVWISVAGKSSCFLRQAHCQIYHDNPDRAFTVPMFTDSMAALAIMTKDRDTNRSRHIDRRFMVTRDLCERGLAKLYHTSGDTFMLADVGTKNLPSSVSDPKVDIACGVPDATIPGLPTTKAEQT